MSSPSAQATTCTTDAPDKTELKETSATEKDEYVLSEQDELLIASLGGQLLSAASLANVPRVQALLANDAPTWFQDPNSGWGPLHFAVGGDGGGDARDADDVRTCVEILLAGGSPWNAGASINKKIL
jgi:hypothetical protein